MKSNNKQNNKFQRGFTLVETMVAVTILTIALSSLLGLTSKSLFTARYARNEITANYLLQEVADYIKNERDTIAFKQSLPSGGWNAFLDKFGLATSGPCFSSDGCYFNVKVTPLDIRTCNSVASFGVLKCPVFLYDENATITSFYNYNTGIPSNFKRKIFLKQNGADSNELYATITLEWLNGNIVRSQSLYMSLLNWTGN